MDDRNKFTESEENQARRNEISSKFVKMGKTLIIEGKEKDDFCILSAGNLLILLSGLVKDPKGMDEFNNLCSMFTAKNILDDMMKTPMGGMMRGGMMDGAFGDMGEDISEILDFLGKQDGNDINDFLNQTDDEDNPDGDK